MLASAPLIVVIEDDSNTCELIELMLTSVEKYLVMSFLGGKEVLQHLSTLLTMQPALFIIDYELPTMTGLDLYDLLRATVTFRHTPVLLMTAYHAQDVYEQLTERPLSIIQKPFGMDEFLTTIEQAIQESLEGAEICSNEGTSTM